MPPGLTGIGAAIPAPPAANSVTPNILSNADELGFNAVAPPCNATGADIALPAICIPLAIVGADSARVEAPLKAPRVARFNGDDSPLITLPAPSSIPAPNPFQVAPPDNGICQSFSEGTS